MNSLTGGLRRLDSMPGGHAYGLRERDDAVRDELH
jgi:hypothetical protein